MKNSIIIVLLLLLACHQPRPVATTMENGYYTCSMHPQVMQRQEGKCPICGMDLIQVKKVIGQATDILQLSDQQVQLGNIGIDTLGRGSIGTEVLLTATLNADETRSSSVNTHIGGRIEKLFFKSAGEWVHKGDHLYDLYSEELNNAKQEYLLALEKKQVLDNSIIDFKQLVNAARNKLLLWGLSEAQVDELAVSKKAGTLTSFYSPSSGYIISLDGHEGDFLAAGSSVMRLADLSSLWAEAQLYSSQLASIDRGAIATVRFPDLGGREIRGQVELFNPEISPDTRINLLRVAIPNSERLYKPGMPAYVMLKNRPFQAITLPQDAVIRNQGNNLVWLQTGHNTFKWVRVETGLEAADRIEIKSGLVAGDRVVTSGAYLLNSEYIFRHGALPAVSHGAAQPK